MREHIIRKNIRLTFFIELYNIILEGNFPRSRLVKNVFVCEVQAVMESGEHGGSQRWQLTIIHLAKAKESCIFDY